MCASTPPGTLEQRGVGDYRGTRIAVATVAATTATSAAAAAISFLGQVMVR